MKALPAASTDDELLAFVVRWAGYLKSGFFAGLPVSYGFFRLFVKKLLIDRLAIPPSMPNPAPDPMGSASKEVS